MAQTQKKYYKVTFSKPIKSISGTAINSSSIVEIKLPKTLKKAVEGSFSGCTNLEAITIASKFKKSETSDNFIEATVYGKKVKFKGL